jgi:hypothetical protein
LSAGARASFTLYLATAGPGETAQRARTEAGDAAVAAARRRWSGFLGPSTTLGDVETALGRPDWREAGRDPDHGRVGWVAATYDLQDRPGYAFCFRFTADGRLAGSGYRRVAAPPPPPPRTAAHVTVVEQLTATGATEEELLAWLGEPADRYGWWPLETWTWANGLAVDLRLGIVERHLPLRRAERVQPNDSLRLGYPGSAPLKAVAKVVAEVLGVELRRRESSFLGGTYYCAGAPRGQQVRIHPNRDIPDGPLYWEAPECPIIICLYKSDRALDDLQACLSERLSARLRRIPFR